MRVTLKKVNDALTKLKQDVRLAKGNAYFYFQGGNADAWLEKTVKVPTVSSLSLEQWLDEFQRLKKLNKEMISTASTKKPPLGPPNKCLDLGQHPVYPPGHENSRICTGING
jgi:hypothetical protein